MTVKESIKILKKLLIQQISQMMSNRMYTICVIVLPLFVTFFFTDIMKEGLPTDLPIGVVDLDNSATSRKLTRTLDAFQGVKVTARYSSVSEARRAMQQGVIYGFFYMPSKMSEHLIDGKQPKLSFYYNAGFLLAGSLAFKDMKTVATLGNAAVGSAKMLALGYTEQQIKATLQPIVISTRLTHNPTLDYNVYLSTTFIPACIGIFIFLVTAYSIGMELKKNHARRWMKVAKNNIYLAIAGKMLPQTLLFTLVVTVYLGLLFGHLHFPYACNAGILWLNGFLFVLAAQGFGIFMFSILPSLRMSMSICALWAVLSFSICGFTFPVEAMDSPLQAVSWLFPVRHYFMIYQMVVLNGYPVYYAWIHYVSLIAFTLLPLCVLPKLKKAMLTYVYMP